MTNAMLIVTSKSFDEVRQWRLEQLERAGYASSDALLLSGRPDVDLHLALRLVHSGCPAETAVRILA